MSTVLAPPSAPRTDRARAPRPPDSGVVDALRFAAFAALVVYGCTHWVRQVAPTSQNVALQMAAAAVALALALRATRTIVAPRARLAAAGALVAVGVVIALTAAGIPLRFVGWRNWAELATGIGEGIVALPNLNVPYRGLDEWVRWTVLSGAALLAVLAAALAYAPRGARHAGRPRSPVPAALVLTLLYGIPVVERNPESPLVSGAGFAVLLALLLGADRLAGVAGARPRLIVAGATAGALGLSALLAPQLDGGGPWLDYRGLAGDLAERNQAAFNWNHSYSPLRWPRDGREVLRVRAEKPAYWKAAVLRRFDGVRWTRGEAEDPLRVDTPRPASEPGWYEELEVTVRSLRSEEYLTAGFASGITEVPRPAQPAGSGTWRTSGRPLRPGDTYTASVYVPRPTPVQLGRAGTTFPDYTDADLTMELPPAVGGPAVGNGGAAATVMFAAFGSSLPTVAAVPEGGVVDGAALMEASAYGRTWATAQALRAAADSPLDLVRRARLRVQDGSRYTEEPAQRPVPLDAFLFDTREGYCQQFSGAMALLLRMAGLPARVASGFSPGSLDSDRGQYIVRDLDAHSWVEAFFPDIGWVTFDPTPTIAPASAQEAGDGANTPGDTEAGAPSRGDTPESAAAAPEVSPIAAPAGGDPGAAPWGALALGGLLVAALGAWLALRSRRRLSAVEELDRALARSGRPAGSGLTLKTLERSLAGSPAAQSYVRKLRLARYAGAAEVPTGRERAALRTELGAGLGVAGRLRAWWALPPRRAAG